MNCYDCTARGGSVPAVAVCVDCGAAVCAGHAEISPRWLTYTVAINRTVRVDPPTRCIRCAPCQRAHQALPAAVGAG